MVNWYLTKITEAYNGTKAVSSINGVGKTGLVHVPPQKSETKPPIYTIHKNKFKMDIRLKCKLQNHKNSRRKHGHKISDTSCSKIFANLSPEIILLKIFWFYKLELLQVYRLPRTMVRSTSGPKQSGYRPQRSSHSQCPSAFCLALSASVTSPGVHGFPLHNVVKHVP